MPKIRLSPCPKNPMSDLDKALPPEETLARAAEALKKSGLDILAETRRVDQGRLGIPVYLAVCGAAGRDVMPTRKQMGKGPTAAQAQASATMELVERYSFFSFWRDLPGAVRTTWSQAKTLFGESLVPVQEIIASVGDGITPEDAERLLDLLEWSFYPATLLGEDRLVWLPLDWFRLLGEFNGSAAGNTLEEALLQGLCELAERHVSAIASEARPLLPTIFVEPGEDAILDRLLAAFRKNGVNVLLKDMSLGTGVPTVGIFAWDPATFPEKSELVFTAGTAASPVKAAIRALTEAAQLGGDFCTGSVYEASGLDKFRSLAEAAWLFSGEKTTLAVLPDISAADIRDELFALARELAPAYAVETTRPELGLPAVWCIAPGLKFRERDKSASVGLFVGRRLSEDADPEKARQGLDVIGEIYGERHFLPFFRGMLALRSQNHAEAARLFGQAAGLAPENEAAALAAFYVGHALFAADWPAAREWLARALALEPDFREAVNLLGVGHYRAGEYDQAEELFNRALKIDKGSAIDLANRGICRKFLGKTAEARADLETALELDPGLDFAARHLRELDAR